MVHVVDPAEPQPDPLALWDVAISVRVYPCRRYLGCRLGLHGAHASRIHVTQERINELDVRLDNLELDVRGLLLINIILHACR